MERRRRISGDTSMMAISPIDLGYGAFICDVLDNNGSNDWIWVGPFVGKDWHIDQFDACDWSLCIFAVFSLVNIQFVYALQAPCHTSRISQSLNWENGILTICWAGFKFHWLRGEMLLLDCSSRAEDIGAFNLFQQVDLSEDLFFYMWFVSSNQDGVYIRPCLKITTWYVWEIDLETRIFNDTI